MINNEEYNYMYNLIYNEFKFLLDLSDDQWKEKRYIRNAYKFKRIDNYKKIKRNW